MTDFRMPMHQGPPGRKPVGMVQHGYSSYQGYDSPRNLAPQPAAQTVHSRTRTTSSNVLPYGSSSHSPHYQAGLGQGPISPNKSALPAPFPPARRLSNTTTSTNSTGNQMAHADVDIRRSASNRSANSQLGYVALMRRQKGTVWCDRAQPEDPRMREQALRDKRRAYLEVHGGGRSGHPSSKNRHGGKGGLDFSPSNLVSAKVPVRLSANEIGDAEDDALSNEGVIHRRTGSGRSSVGSSRYPSGYQRPSGTMGSNSTPPSEKTDLPEVTENPPAEVREEEKSRVSSLTKDDAGTTHSSEQEDMVGDMQAPSAAIAASEKAKKADELRRRGSVDERTMSLGNVRLFVANPDDLSD
ncbi:hypothetical protein N7468_008305 [Penicillium chermesinum]|uniref:Uncharacterized protein n=1 Tax=Penicillium chermesinum TaxID=63820 RepID=A0A9W9NRT1_9EURO|nr:uncharacterized protein N7468_008305 [Penicillium chermesinum]KAJ5223763.1 hypothetical protein N7468_008305 [Penicillium chermesinum]KAJ6155410.1 hypothetical protein N7470_005976 [Penicillium chermesinum]